MTALASKPLHIRRAVRDDLAAMARIERVSFSDPWSEETLATALFSDRMMVLVADEGGEALGDGAANSGRFRFVARIVRSKPVAVSAAGHTDLVTGDHFGPATGYFW